MQDDKKRISPNRNGAKHGVGVEADGAGSDNGGGRCRRPVRVHLFGGLVADKAFGASVATARIFYWLAYI